MERLDMEDFQKRCVNFLGETEVLVACVCSGHWLFSVLQRKKSKAVNCSVMQGECADCGRALAVRPAPLTLRWMYVLLFHLKCCLRGALVSGGRAVNGAQCRPDLLSFNPNHPV